MTISLSLPRGLILLGLIILLSLACRTTDVISGRNDAATTESRATVRPTFTPASTAQAKVVTPTPTRPRATAPRAATAPPTFTPIPLPTLPPAPPPTPAGPWFKVSGKACVEGGNTRVIGTVYDRGQKVNGLKVRVSWAPGGEPAITDAVTGTYYNDPKRVDSAIQGQYTLALYEGQRVQGNWYVFIITNNGDVLSEMGNVQTSEGPGCNIATIDFTH